MNTSTEKGPKDIPWGLFLCLGFTVSSGMPPRDTFPSGRVRGHFPTVNLLLHPTDDCLCRNLTLSHVLEHLLGGLLDTRARVHTEKKYESIHGSVPFRVQLGQHAVGVILDLVQVVFESDALLVS